MGAGPGINASTWEEHGVCIRYLSRNKPHPQYNTTPIKAMRIVWRFSRNKRLLGVLVTASFLLLIWSLSGSSTTFNESSDGDVFYDDQRVHRFVVDGHSKPYQREVEDPVEFIPNRKRTLKTSYGIIEVKDLSFVPVNPLKKGQSLLSRLSKQVDELPYKKPKEYMHVQDVGPAPGKQYPNPNAGKFNSFLQQKRKNNERIVNRAEGGRNQFLNSEKMIALQAQLRARERQVVNGNIYAQKGEEKRPVAHRNTTECKRQLCKDFLTSRDLPHYRYCIKKSKVLSDQEPSESQCNFVNGTRRNAVALASHPGSGHLWVRELLQKSTGICTGGVNCDVHLRRRGYPGECLRSGVVLVVKTHQTEPRWTGIHYDDSVPYKGFSKAKDIPVYGSAILLLRDPFDAIADLWQHLKGEGIITDERWSDFIFEQATEWQQIVLAWLTNNHNHPVLTVRFEDLKLNTADELKKMLEFLQVPYSTSMVQELVQNVYDDKLSVVYTSDERNYINSVVKSTVETLRTYKVDTKLDMLSYLKD